MKRLLLVTVILLLFIALRAFCQTSDGNPFKRLGYKPSTYTFSGGKEFHDQETIVIIGSTLFDTHKNKVIGFVENPDSLKGLRPELQSMSIDPLCEKYCSISPYVYCMNNPIKLIDPTGTEVWIYYEDGNGKMQQMLYSANMKYKGDNEFVSRSVGYLNAVYESGGNKMLNVLIDSKNAFNIKNQMATDNKGNSISAFSFDESVMGGGDISAGLLMNSGIGEFNKIQGISHELFHGLQYEKGQGGASIFNEMEARIFSNAVATNWVNKTDNWYGVGSYEGIGNGSNAGTIYSNAFSNLLRAYSPEQFVSTVLNFKKGAESNASGVYNSYPLIKKNQKHSLLYPFYPKKP